jgi:hypothetical protein
MQSTNIVCSGSSSVAQAKTITSFSSASNHQTLSGRRRAPVHRSPPARFPQQQFLIGSFNKSFIFSSIETLCFY